jgi:hypothetical protein
VDRQVLSRVAYDLPAVRYSSAALGAVLIVLAGRGGGLGQALPTTTQPIPRTQPIPICTSAQFVTNVTTNASVYSLGQPVTIFMTVHNTAGTCNNYTGTGVTNIVTNCFAADVWDGHGSQETWVPPQVDDPNCTTPPRRIIPADWSNNVSLMWHQVDCVNLEYAVTSTTAPCPNTQVPPGRYQILGVYGPITPYPVYVQITS